MCSRGGRDRARDCPLWRARPGRPGAHLHAAPGNVTLALSRILDHGAKHPELLAILKRVFEHQPDALERALTAWLLGRLPVSVAPDPILEDAETALRADFRGLGDMEKILDALSAVRAHATGDAKALLSLPIEIRQPLLEAQQGTHSGSGVS